MGKEPGCSVSETIQLCLSWLETSENAVRGAGQKKSSFQRSFVQPLAAKQEPKLQVST
ncbi:hypothetical protein PC116_g7863 [Phytophthora cactorum]|nr:hypothetical protein PC116_g7863 [Phytophthora cactorum]